jgi:hypothetical protein
MLPVGVVKRVRLFRSGALEEAVMSNTITVDMDIRGPQ